jgi:hypothetical protein
MDKELKKTLTKSNFAEHTYDKKHIFTNIETNKFHTQYHKAKHYITEQYDIHFINDSGLLI